MLPRISLDLFQQTVREAATETMERSQGQVFNDAGIIPVMDQTRPYDCTPLNTRLFATTGGDGVHFSLLELSASVQPVIMTVPMNFWQTMESCNCILAENLEEFLSLGYFKGWFSLEQLFYDRDRIIKFYQSEEVETDDLSGGDLQFVKLMRRKLEYMHVPLDQDRLEALHKLYFDKLIFKDR